MDMNEKARVFSALGDPLRLKIVEALSERGEACGKELSSLLGASVALVSHHAKILEDAGLILRRKEGQFSRFSLNSETIARIRDDAPLGKSACS